ncbi:MAG: hypothetical protein IT430_06635 [Phycisphaerales bacterium]|nr:hypothetical protein [Phycisphaerales bacterium]
MTSSPAAPPRILTDQDRAQLNTIARWQKFLLWGVLLNLATIALTMAVDPVFGLVNLLVGLALIVLVANLGAALGDNIVSRILYCIGLLLPLISLIILVVLNQRATSILKAHGIPVGLMGARIPRTAA